MARRTLVNIEGKILDAVVNKGAKYGVDNVSTIQIAKKCGITEPTIFVHFKTKTNLLYQAYLYVEKKLDDEFFFNQEIQTEEPDVYKVWMQMFDFFQKNQTVTKYFDSYRHYSFYNPDDDSDYDEKHMEVFYKLIDRKKSFSKAEMLILMIHIIDSTVNYAVKMAEGKIPSDDATKKFIFDLIIGGIKSK